MDINQVIAHFGSTTALCKALGVFPQHVSHWKKRGIPRARQHDIEAVTGGKFVADRSHLPGLPKPPKGR